MIPTYTKQEKRNSLTNLKGFLGRAQISAIASGLMGEEGDFFVEKCAEYADRIKTMPKTYEQDGKGEDAIVYLHYFTGGADWYITEKDSDPDGEGQIQAFGLADLFQDGGELGYINLKEITACGAELDLYWTPKPLKEARKQ